MTDILFDFETTTIFKNGDLNVGESDEQHKTLLMICEKGSFKQFPATCVGVRNYLESEDPAGLLREVVAQFTADGMKVSSTKITNGNLSVDASY